MLADMTNTPYADIKDAMHVSVPRGISGNVEIRDIVITEEEARFSNLRAALKGRGGITAGTYTGLYRNGRLWMSDTPDEQNDHMAFVRHVNWEHDERVLVSGLGLGMVIAALAVIPSVQHVTVIELDADVIALVGPHVLKLYAEAGKTLEIVQGDATDPKALFAPGTHWDAAWHDIFEHISEDNLPVMSQMARRYGKRVGRQDFWSRSLLTAMLARGNRSRY
jgi:hypothetical protein